MYVYTTPLKYFYRTYIYEQDLKNFKYNKLPIYIGNLIIYQHVLAALIEHTPTLTLEQ